MRKSIFVTRNILHGVEVQLYVAGWFFLCWLHQAELSAGTGVRRRVDDRQLTWQMPQVPTSAGLLVCVLS